MAEEEVGLRLSLKDRRETAAGLQEVEGGLDDVGNAADNAGRKAESSGRRFAGLRGALGAVSRGVGFTVKVVGALTVAAGALGLKTAAGMEQARIGFTTMLGSGKRAQAFLASLQRFAAETPFEFPDLQTAASSLISVGVRAKNVVPIMRSLGNATAGMGTGSEGIKRATVALQQMIAAQKVSAEDLNQLRDAGIPVYDLLTRALGKSRSQIAKLIQDGELGADAVQGILKALRTGQGLEKFNGMMEAQSRSLSGVWSTLKDTVSMGLAKAIQPALPMVKDLVIGASDLATKAMPRLRAGVQSFVTWLQKMIDAYKAGGVRGILDEVKGASGEGLSRVGSAFSKVGSALATIDWSAFGDALSQGASDTVSVFAVVIGFLADHVDELAKAMPYLVAGFVAYKAAQAAANALAILAVPMKIAETAATIAHTRALKANSAAVVTNRGATAASAAATATNTAATNAGVIANTRARVATIAKTAAEKAAAVASKAWAAAQWLLNAAMSANPLMLVVIGIGLLIGAAVLAYKKIAWFRVGVDVAFKAIGAGVGWVVGFVKRNWPLLLTIILGPLGLIVALVIRNFDRIKSFVSGAIEGTKNAVGRGLQFMKTAFFRFSPVGLVISQWSRMKAAAASGASWLVGQITSLPGRIAGVAGKFAGAGRALVEGLMRGLRSFGKSAAGLAGDIWSGIKDLINGGINKMNDAIPNSIGKGPVSIDLPDNPIPRLARGGPVEAGESYIVGDRGPRHAWELFTPTTDGYVHPRVPSVSPPAMPSTLTPSEVEAGVLGPDTDVRVGRSHPGGPTVIQLVVDGKVLAETVVDDIEDKSARA